MSLHVGIIPDGNRRYAVANNKTIAQQYHDSYIKLKEIVDTWTQEEDLGIGQLSMYVCSQDNLQKRSSDEVDLLYQTLRQLIEDYKDKFEEGNDVRLEIVGKVNDLPKDIRKDLNKIRRKTKKNDKYVLRLAIAYDGRQEIQKAFRKLDRKKLDFTDDNLKEEFGPDLDIVIRTGKEKRLSGFFPWQTVYSELFFLDIYWPEFSWQLLKIVLQDFENRKRRYGS